VVDISDGAGSPLSLTEEAAWLNETLRGPSATYNTWLVLDTAGRLSVEPLRRRLRTLVDRHELLRSGYRVVDGVLRRVVEPVPEAAPEILPCADAVRAAQALTRQVFDTTRPPLWRLVLLRGPDRDLLALVFHHLILDGWSMRLLLEELAADAEPPTGRPSYRDFAEWQRRQLDSGGLDAALRFWAEHLRDAPLCSSPVPTATPRAAAKSGTRMCVPVPEPGLRRVLGTAAGNRTTPFAVWVTAVAAAVGESAGRADVVLGIPSSGRVRPADRDTLGLFAQALAIRLRGDPTEPFPDRLRHTHRTLTGALRHQVAPIAEVVRRVAPHRRSGLNPLFQVMVAPTWDNGSVRIQGHRCTEVTLASGTAKFDLLLHVPVTPDGGDMHIEYDTAILTERAAAAFGGRVLTLCALPSTPASAPALAYEPELPTDRRHAP
jgi:hypothetical protein